MTSREPFPATPRPATHVVAGYPPCQLVATLEELAQDPDRRVVITGRWRSHLGLAYDEPADAAVAIAMLTDVAAAVCDPFLTCLLTQDQAPLLSASQTSVGWDLGPQVAGVGWRPMPLVRPGPDRQQRDLLRHHLVETLAPVTAALCGDGGIDVGTGWAAVADTLQEVGLDIGARIGDPAGAAAELILWLDGTAPLSSTARLTAVATGGEVTFTFERTTCCHRRSGADICATCPVQPPMTAAARSLRGDPSLTRSAQETT